MIKCLPTETRSNKTVCNSSSLFFLRTLLEEYLPKNVFLLVEGVIVLDIVVVGLVEHTVWIVIAIGIFVSNSSNLTQLHVRICTLIWIFPSRHSRTWSVGIVSSLSRSIRLREVLAGEQKHLLMEATNNWNFRLLLGLLRLWLRLGRWVSLLITLWLLGLGLIHLWLLLARRGLLGLYVGESICLHLRRRLERVLLRMHHLMCTLPLALHISSQMSRTL